MFSLEFLQKEKVKATKERDQIAKDIISLVIGDLQTAQYGNGFQIENKPCSESDFIKNILNKMQKNITSNLTIFQKRGDTLAIDKANKELSYIERTFFKKLSEDELTNIAKNFKVTNPEAKTSGFMTFLKNEYLGQYDGKLAVAIFSKL